MPQKPNKSGTREQEAFAKYLAEAPDATEAANPRSVTLVGTLLRSAKEGLFQLASGGQVAELPVDAVLSHRVVQGSGAQRTVELSVDPAKLPPDWRSAKPVGSDVLTRKELIKEVAWDHVKQVHTDWLIDTLFWADHHTFKEPVKDPVTDPITLPEQIFPPGTLAEGVIPDPATIATQPPTVAAQAMQAPFVLATPHHAPASALAMQMGPAATQALAPATQFHTLATTDYPHTLFWLDSPQTPPWLDQRHTWKEVIKDPITDPITIWEGGAGTIQEGAMGGGGVVNPPVWNFPGMMV